MKQRVLAVIILKHHELEWKTTVMAYKLSEMAHVTVKNNNVSNTTHKEALPPISEPTDFGKDKPTSRCQTIHLMWAIQFMGSRVIIW